MHCFDCLVWGEGPKGGAGCNVRVWLNPSAQAGDERGTESIVYFVDRRVVRQAGIRNQRGSQTGGDQEPAGESDRRGSGTRRRVRQAGIRNRGNSQTGRDQRADRSGGRSGVESRESTVKHKRQSGRECLGGEDGNRGNTGEGGWVNWE